jgi:hypothetical protein
MSCLPWLTNINSSQLPWNVAQTLYDRIVSVRRLKTVAGSTDNIGNVGYSGAEQSTGVEGESILFVGLPALIQVGAVGRTQKGGLPGDAVTKPVWIIYIPASNISIYSIRDRDIIMDDEGYRYEVGANYWNGGYQLSTIRLEA